MTDNKTVDEHTSELSDEDLDTLRQESTRQEIDDFQESLHERDKGLKVLQDAQQTLEDELEDANTEVDRLQRELDRSVVEKEEADYLRREAESARKQLESSIYNIQEGVEESKVTNLRDERMHRSRRTLAMQQITGGPFIKGVVVGLIAGLLIGYFAASVFTQ